MKLGSVEEYSQDSDNRHVPKRSAPFFEGHELRSIRVRVDSSKHTQKNVEIEIRILITSDPPRRSQHDAKKNYRALLEYKLDLYAYGVESMSVLIALTNKWLTFEHLGVNLLDFDRFLAPRWELEHGAE
ncbi:hypothetical protein Fot_56652 [Forsythia ovata]|uniref:Uncharacterized protein n=1 Tax=Forsythia ovata TaxID=205694 RepID=A0ABD1NZ05_9LAMI